MQQMAQVWVWFHDIPLEFMHLNILTGFAKVVGYSVRIDSATINNNRIMFARILIEIDFN